jgi:hypothetical protein
MFKIIAFLGMMSLSFLVYAQDQNVLPVQGEQDSPFIQNQNPSFHLIPPVQDNHQDDVSNLNLLNESTSKEKESDSNSDAEQGNFDKTFHTYKITVSGSKGVLLQKDLQLSFNSISASDREQPIILLKDSVETNPCLLSNDDSKNSHPIDVENIHCPKIYVHKIFAGKFLKDPNDNNRVGLVLTVTELASYHKLDNVIGVDKTFFADTSNEAQALFFITVFNLDKNQSVGFEHYFDEPSVRHQGQTGDCDCSNNTERYDVLSGTSYPNTNFLKVFGDSRININVERIN